MSDQYITLGKYISSNQIAKTGRGLVWGVSGIGVTGATSRSFIRDGLSGSGTLVMDFDTQGITAGLQWDILLAVPIICETGIYCQVAGGVATPYTVFIT
ncbi:MAG: hypothetical protein EPN91_09180 [Salinibacterium sp.]|nr:MAG: hypothetical protein EPN91_09180 [Salinibacterium sp.]